MMFMNVLLKTTKIFTNLTNSGVSPPICIPPLQFAPATPFSDAS